MYGEDTFTILAKVRVFWMGQFLIHHAEGRHVACQILSIDCIALEEPRFHSFIEPQLTSSRFVACDLDACRSSAQVENQIDIFSQPN